jgi:transposase-like protein
MSPVANLCGDGETDRIELSAEERCELEHVAACYTRSHKEVQRAKLVLYAADGEPNVEIGRRLDMSPEVVGRWRKRFAEERLDGLKDRPRAGRPRRFPPGRGRAGQGSRVRAAPEARRPALALQQI